MTVDALTLLLETTLAASAAVLVVLLLRWPLRAAFGAGAVYGAWLLVPAAIVAVLLPAARVFELPVIAEIPPTQIAPLLDPVAAASASASVDPRAWLFVLWLVGVVLMLAMQARRQQRFLRTLGPLRQRADGLLQAEASVGLPAVLGWPARIVLPGDFEQRYDAAERELVLCHEAVHLRRGDLPASALVAALRCLFWFNPLVHHAAARFRHDQELACDAAVLRRFPDSRRRYGDALLKTQLDEEPLPVGCHWFGIHPLKERILMLKKPLPSKLRWFSGLVAVAALSLSGAMLAWASQPPELAEPADGEVLLMLGVRIDGGDAQGASAVVKPGERHEFEFAANGEKWLLEVAVAPLADGRFDLTSSITKDGQLLAQPRLIFDATGAKLAIGGDPGTVTDGIEVEMHARLGGAPVAGESAYAPTDVGVSEMLDSPAPADEVTTPVAIMADADVDPAIDFAVQPVYPRLAMAKREGGTVRLRVHVGPNGRVLDAEYSDRSTVPADSDLVQAAHDAVVRWRFKPAMKDGQAVASYVEVPVVFQPPRGLPIAEGSGATARAR